MSVPPQVEVEFKAAFSRTRQYAVIAPGRGSSLKSALKYWAQHAASDGTILTRTR
jgi:hypothetical protein